MKINLRCGDRMTANTGYGVINRQLQKTLQSFGHKVGAGLQLLDKADLEIYACPPYHFTNRTKAFTVGLTMTEREDLSGYKFDWAGCCNQMDLIVTPSEWNKRVFLIAGITVPVAVVPLGLDTFWRPRPYRFLSIVDGLGDNSRWNWRDLLKAYRGEFTNEPVEWTIKVRVAGKKVSSYAQRQPKIDIIDRELSEPEMLQLYQSHDCYLSYSREGWGYPIWEALACGLNVIVPHYGVQAEYLQGSSKVHFFDGGRIAPDQKNFVHGDMREVRELMRWLYQIGRFGLTVTRRYSWRQCAENLLSAVEKAKYK